MCDPGTHGAFAEPRHWLSRSTLAMDDGCPLPVVTCTPAGARASVVIAPDIFGLSPTTIHVTQRLADLGLASLALGYHARVAADVIGDGDAARDRRRAMDELRAIADLDNAIDWVRSHQPTSRRGRVGLIGFCMGGTLALDLAAQRDDLAVICCYGFPNSSQMPRVAAPRPLDLVAEMSGPILGLWGDQDGSVPVDDIGRLSARLRTHAVDARIEIHPGAGHGFMTAIDDATSVPREAAWDSVARFAAEAL